MCNEITTNADPTESLKQWTTAIQHVENYLNDIRYITLIKSLKQ